MEETIPFKTLHSRECQGHKKKVHSMAWNCTGTKLASGSVDQTARVWHIEPHGHGKVKDIELKGQTDSVDQLCWDPKHADLIATASGDKTVQLWDAQSGKCSQQTELSGENINITYKPDGTHIAVGNWDDELKILDVRKFKPLHIRKFNYEELWKCLHIRLFVWLIPSWLIRLVAIALQSTHWEDILRLEVLIP